MPTIKNYQEKNEKAERAYKFYLNKGYTPEQSSAIVGNLIRESGLNPSAVGDSGKAFGLAQWHPDRQAKAKELYGEAWKDFDNQLKFVDWELNNTEKSAGDALKKSKTVWEAGRVFTNSYERPKLTFDQDETRQTHVADVYRNYAKMQLTEEDKNMFKPTFAKDVAPYMNMQSNNISILPETEINTTFAQIPQVEIDYLNQLEQQTQLPQQTETAQVTQQEDTFMQDLLAEISKGVEYVKPVERDIMQSGGIIKDNNGYWNPENWGKQVEISSPSITMKGVNQPLWGTSKETGETKLMMPNEDYYFSNTESVIETPTYQQGGQKKPLIVNDKNDPRYKAYQDSLVAYSRDTAFDKELIEIVKRKGTITEKERQQLDKKYPLNNVKPKKEYGLNKAPILFTGDKGYKVKDLMVFKKPQQPVIVQSNIHTDKQGNTFSTGDNKLTGKPQLVKRITELPPRDTPQVTPLQQIQTQGVVESDFTLKPIDINIPKFAPTPKSFDIEYSAQRMNEGTGYYDQNNVQGVDIETALRAQEQADRMNQYWQEKYGNSQNPKAQERLKQLQDNVKITPNYQQGGEIKYSENEKKFLEELKQLKLI